MQTSNRHAVHAIVDGVMRDGSVLGKDRASTVAEVLSATLEVNGPNEARMRQDLNDLGKEDCTNDSTSNEPETNVNEYEDGDDSCLQDEADSNNDGASEEDGEDDPSDEGGLAEVRINVTSLDDEVHTPEHQETLVSNRSRKEVNSVLRRAVVRRSEVIFVNVVGVLERAQSLPETHDEGLNEKQDSNDGSEHVRRDGASLLSQLLSAREDLIDTPCLGEKRTEDDHESVVSEPRESHATSVVQHVHVDHQGQESQEDSSNNDETEDRRGNDGNGVLAVVPNESSDKDGNDRQNSSNDGECNDESIRDVLRDDRARSRREGLSLSGCDQSRRGQSIVVSSTLFVLGINPIDDDIDNSTTEGNGVGSSGREDNRISVTSSVVVIQRSDRVSVSSIESFVETTSRVENLDVDDARGSSQAGIVGHLNSRNLRETTSRLVVDVQSGETIVQHGEKSISLDIKSSESVLEGQSRQNVSVGHVACFDSMVL